MENVIDTRTVETPAVVNTEIPPFLVRTEGEVLVQIEDDLGGKEVTIH